MNQQIGADSKNSFTRSLAEDFANRFGGVSTYPAAAVRNTCIVVAGTALIAICAHISFPLWFTPVPVTLQPFAVLLLGTMLSPRIAAATMLTYLFEGAAGIPVFSPHGLGGVAHLLGPTGGYLLSYPLVAPMVSWAWRRGVPKFGRGVWIAEAGSLITLTIGALWLGILTHSSLRNVLNLAVLPFLPGDVLKVLATAAVATTVGRLKNR